MMNEWKAFLESSAAEWKLPVDGKWSCLFFNNYQVQCTNLDLLWFHDGGEYPLAIAKMSRDDQILRREYANLERVWACAPRWTPRPLAFRRSGPFSQLWMTGVPGRALSSLTPAPSVVEAVGGVIASLHEAVRKTSAPAGPERRQRMVMDPLTTLAGYGDDAGVRAGCMELMRGRTAEWIEATPVIPQHGDLFAGNVLLHKDEAHIVDWESFGTVDLPFYDLITFLLSVLMTAGEQPEAWDGALVQRAPAIVAAYARRLGLDTKDFSLAFPLALANWFHLQTVDGRPEFSSRMYKTAVHYFRNTSKWNAAFLAAN